MSNLQGTDVVASLVVFEDGLPRKAEYRRFAVKGHEGFDDVAAIKEVLSRRFRRLRDNRGGDEVAQPLDPETGRPRKFAYAPGLVVVDGGQPQVNAARLAMDEAGVADIPVIGLAKRLEEVVVDSSDDPVILPRTSEGLYLLQRIRDEAHRFAIAYHRQRRSRSMVDSLLDGVPGWGRRAGRRCWPGSGRSSSCGQPPPTRSARCRGSGAEPQMPWSRPSARGGLPSR